MSALQKNGDTLTVSESSIVLIGLLCTIVGLLFQDSFGITSLLAAIGIGLVVAGTVYIAVEASELVRMSMAFVALVALPLLSYGSVMRWVGGLMIGTVAAGAVYSRVTK